MWLPQMMADSDGWSLKWLVTVVHLTKGDTQLPKPLHIPHTVSITTHTHTHCISSYASQAVKWRTDTHLFSCQRHT